MRILFFGDSITQGFVDPTGGWVRRLSEPYVQQLLDNPANYGPYFFNLGISGDTSAKILKRFTADVENRVWPGEEFVIVIAVGTNDACVEGGKPWATPEQYQQNIAKLFEQALKYSSKVLAIETPPCDESKTNPCAWGDYSYSNKDIRKFNAALHSVCQEMHLPYVAVFDAFAGREKDLLPDGLHPGPEGHQLIADLVQPELEKLIK